MYFDLIVLNRFGAHKLFLNLSPPLFYFVWYGSSLGYTVLNFGGKTPTKCYHCWLLCLSACALYVFRPEKIGTWQYHKGLSSCHWDVCDRVLSTYSTYKSRNSFWNFISSLIHVKCQPLPGLVARCIGTYVLSAGMCCYLWLCPIGCWRHNDSSLEFPLYRLEWWCPLLPGIPLLLHYRKTSCISRTLVGNKIVDHSDVVGASPVGAAPTTSSFST